MITLYHLADLSTGVSRSFVLNDSLDYHIGDIVNINTSFTSNDGVNEKVTFVGKISKVYGNLINAEVLIGETNTSIRNYCRVVFASGSILIEDVEV